MPEPDGYAPAWLESLAARGSPKTPTNGNGTIPKGARHATFMSRAGAMRRQGLEYAEIRAQLVSLRERSEDKDFPLHELDRIARDAAAYAPGPKHLTDTGNAERFLSQHGGNLRFSNGDWYIWDGRRFKKDETGQVYVLAKETIRSIYLEASECPDERDRKGIVSWAKASESTGRLRAMVENASWDDRVARSTDDFDRDPYKLNVANGTIDLRTGYLLPHDRADDNTKIAEVQFDPKTECPAFKAFLNRILPDATLRAFVLRFIGYTLTGTAKEEKMLLLHGTGANGKSTLIETVRHILGDYAVSSSSEILTLQKFDDNSGQAIARLAGARFVTVDESAAGSKLDAEKVKTLTSPNRRTARFLYRNAFEFTITHKLWMATNHPPEADAQDDALARRLWPLEFGVVIPENERDPDLVTKLQGEAPGILALVVKEAVQWQSRGLEPPTLLREQKTAFLDENDTLSRFLSECCVMEETGAVRVGELYAAYAMWTKTNREVTKPRNLFGSAMRRVPGVTAWTANKGVRMYRGIRLDNTPTIWEG